MTTKETLRERIKPFLEQHPEIKAVVLDGGEVWLWYPHTKQHGDRPFVATERGPRLSPLKIKEANLLGLIVAEIAGADFEVDFEMMCFGCLVYKFVRK